jgi:hypothetical protein
VAELVDNALQAGAGEVSVRVEEDQGAGLRISVLDNGCGMDAARLSDALRFGGSERFGDRSGSGRFGMGLPNSSVSQARRVEVFTWTSPDACHRAYLDVDEIASGGPSGLARPCPAPVPTCPEGPTPRSGTLVVWSRCDRVPYRRSATIEAKLAPALGRWYRRAIWAGVRITVNGRAVEPVDPLFLHPAGEAPAALPYGEPLEYPIRIPGSDRTSTIRVRFVELPVDVWAARGIEEKRAAGIIGGAGVSVLRADREIDSGWHFMGGKRRENYDDWWRCEVSFDPELDEWFGVTHSKQGISPIPQLRAILNPDLEPIARTLNARVRARFAAVKAPSPSPAAQRASARDRLLPPGAGALPPQGFVYRVVSEALGSEEFFRPIVLDDAVVLVLNVDHPFHERLYVQVCTAANSDLRFGVEATLLAAGRALLELADDDHQALADRLRVRWSDALAVFLT